MTERLYNNPDQFRNQSWAKRFEKMGDQAEAAYEADRNEKGIPFVRAGLNRPPFQVHRLPMVERYRPDYMELKQYVEVQGYGRDQTVKLKVEKLDALQKWDRIMPVMLFLYDSTSNSSSMIPLETIVHLTKNRPTEQFPEGKKYYAIHASELKSPFDDDGLGVAA